MDNDATQILPIAEEYEVYASNTVAIELYQKAGFIVEGIKKRGRKTDAGYDDVVGMGLLF